ncbi:hypothetical protein RM704_35850 [Streptomyces sp. DSM 3412]|uniref:DUF4157 domain-containing protein n=1 Tax=Streptomyces gottesmaniae TaxID=3075518 RepID=A0ABU2ZBN1_9ACTN|nr:hypothetical protein [Streptomyces sp. DSM 3412]MDT0572777.1 hypothetical protein [Streptomyces sp. DSM 3412]
MGLVLAVVGTLRGRVPSRCRLAVVGAGAAVQLVLAGFFVTSGPNGHSGAWETTRVMVNAPVSGAALLYGAGKGGDLYQNDNGTTAVVLDGGVVRAGTMFGTVFLTDQGMETETPRTDRLSEHEARHSDQWAAFSIAAGPAAFPALYALDETFFPGAFNHFERHAGLEDGGYDTPSDCPSIAGQLTLASMTLLAGSALVVRRRFRTTSSPRKGFSQLPTGSFLPQVASSASRTIRGK